MNNVYFSGIPDIGDLILVATLFDFDGYEVVFICRDINFNIYLCVATDVLYGYTCLITKTSLHDINLLINDKATVYELLVKKSEIIECIDRNKFNIKNMEDFSMDDLPEKDEYLELSSDEINIIKFQINDIYMTDIENLDVVLQNNPDSLLEYRQNYNNELNSNDIIDNVAQIFNPIQANKNIIFSKFDCNLLAS